MGVDIAVLDRASTGFRGLFIRGGVAAVLFYADLVMEIASTAKIEEYEVPKEIGTMREWVGDRHTKDGGVFSFQIKNKTWEVTRSVPVDVLEDDKAGIGLYGPIMEEFGARAVQHPDELLATYITDGLSGAAKSFDGVAYFSDSHPIKGDVQSNKVTGALSATTFNEGYAKLLKMKDFDGKPLSIGSGELVLMVGPDNRATAAGILDAPTLSSGAANINYKAARLVVNPWFTGTKWILARVKGPVRPFILQMRRKPKLVVMNQPTNTNVFMANEVLYGVDGRWSFGGGFYQLCVGGPGA